MDAPEPPATFIVRVTRAEDGEISGVVERPRMGVKHRFRGAATLARYIEEALERNRQAGEGGGSDESTHDRHES
jgi:hypothetical protein